ncbi:MAG TPA: cytochrome c4 [Gammaproteobacteria bacterium]|nr:cytochrome c4 [Gammaproteobacteria bacterium]
MGSAAYAAAELTVAPAKAKVCMSCHGQGGRSTRDKYPILAGQVPGYIAKQLADFKSGARKFPIMSGMAAKLSKQDMADLDAYFSSQPGVTGSVKKADLPLALYGEKIFRGGHKKLSVSPCMACHAPDGKGVMPHFPRLAGQHAAYIEKQLFAFKASRRTSDNSIMQEIAFRLSAKEIKALALYVQGIK